MINRDQLGQVVRLAWIEHSSKQFDTKPAWLLMAWEHLPESSKEMNKRIGEAVANFVLSDLDPIAFFQEAGYAIPPRIFFEDVARYDKFIDALSKVGQGDLGKGMEWVIEQAGRGDH